ncbi:MAG: amino acid adenylation domain-containing protein [Pseudomonadales bacterium]
MKLVADILLQAAALHSQRIAVVDGARQWTYWELDGYANQLARCLLTLGIKKGDRVGVWMEKSGESIASFQAILRVGAIYVPLDPLSPTARINAIISDCSMKGIVLLNSQYLSYAGDQTTSLAYLILDGVASSRLTLAKAEIEAMAPNPLSQCHPEILETDLAYILYTSGSTGTPKGVCISHKNSRAFIDWAMSEIQPNAQDHFSSHAPFHFDLSVFDIYVCMSAGASLHIVSESISYVTKRLVEFVAQHQISIWYSVPTAIIQMMDFDFDESRHDLRIIIFAGEVFPVKHLCTLKKRFPKASLYNFYGPTETNVCTYYKVKNDPKDTLPIGRVCSGNSVKVVNNGVEVSSAGQEGELLVKGDSVFSGYWGQQHRQGEYYATGDKVRLLKDGHLAYVGRLDNMVKIKGYRVELDEIEKVMATADAVKEVIVSIVGEGMAALIVAHVVLFEDTQFSLLKAKQLCAKHLPRYMIVNKIHYLESFPNNSNGKVDRQKLYELTAQEAVSCEASM